MTSTHHATLLRAEAVQSVTVSITPDTESSDVYVEKLGIADARELIRQAHQRPAEATKRHFVIRSEFMTLEAQNALLKILEEPPLSTSFTFILPTEYTVLPTLLSRFASVSVAGQQPVQVEDSDEVFKDFLQHGHKERLQQIEAASKQKDLTWQRGIRSGLLRYLNSPARSPEHVRELAYVTQLLLTRGASNKMLLEHAALLLPTRSK